MVRKTVRRNLRETNGRQRVITKQPGKTSGPQGMNTRNLSNEESKKWGWNTSYRLALKLNSVAENKHKQGPDWLEIHQNTGCRTQEDPYNYKEITTNKWGQRPAKEHAPPQVPVGKAANMQKRRFAMYHTKVQVISYIKGWNDAKRCPYPVDGTRMSGVRQHP